jgi:hypothetical protein
MPEHHIFLSHKRERQMSPLAQRMFDRIEVELSHIPVTPFIDTRSIDAGEAWEPEIDRALARATMFVGFVSINFWRSQQCRRELDIALARYRQEGLPKLLFVLAEALDHKNLALDRQAIQQTDGEEKAIEAQNRVDDIRRLGDVNFLGPYSAEAGQLTPLVLNDFHRADQQIQQLVARIGQLKAVAR